MATDKHHLYFIFTKVCEYRSYSKAAEVLGPQNFARRVRVYWMRWLRGIICGLADRDFEEVEFADFYFEGGGDLFVGGQGHVGVEVADCTGGEEAFEFGL